MKKGKPPNIEVKFVKAGAIKTIRRRKPSRETAGLKYDMSQFYSMKSVLESLFGRTMYSKLKEAASFGDWQAATSKLLDSIMLSIETTVQIADQDWRDEVVSLAQDGRARIKEATTMADLFSVLSATLTQIIFIQIGDMPSHYGAEATVPLVARYWRLDRFRTVQYVQHARQREAVEALKSRREETAKRARAVEAGRNDA
jgi:hypothetical protein